MPNGVVEMDYKKLVPESGSLCPFNGLNPCHDRCMAYRNGKCVLIDALAGIVSSLNDIVAAIYSLESRE